MYELFIHLDAHKKSALYEQIYESIKNDIVDGKLTCGEKLPSTRLLAAHLSISRSTVETAYGQLVSEGYIEARKGSGYYVCDIGQLYGTGGLSKSGARHQAQDTQAVEISMETQMKIQMKNPIKIPSQMQPQPDRDVKIDFFPGRIDAKAFPYQVWRKVNKEALLELEYESLEAGHPQGEYRLRKAIAGYLYRARGVRCVPEQIVVGAGNESLLQLLSQMLSGPRVAVMESPTYLQAYHTFCNMGYCVKAVPMDDGGIRVEEIPLEDASLVYVMPSHQFPFGSVMPFKRRRQLLAWAKEREGRYIIEDDHDSEFRYVGKPIPSLHSMEKQGRVIYLGTFSNSIMPSIRVSYLALPPELLRVYFEKCGFYSPTVSRSLQSAVCKFMEGGYFERHLNKMRRVYKGKHDELLRLLKGKPWVERIYGGRAGLHIGVEMKSALSEEEIMARAKKRGVRVQGMSGYYIEGRRAPGDHPILLLGFGNLTVEQIREGVAVLEECVR